jgi:DNA-binding response OmpR family regulator
VNVEAPGILLIEDDFDDANQVARVLRKYRIDNHLEIARGVEEALRLLRGGFSARTQLVMIDCTLPDKPAMEAVIRVRSLPGLDQVPVIICCGAPEEEQQVKQWGIKRVVSMSKPAGFFKLLECIQKLEMHWRVFGSKP